MPSRCWGEFDDLCAWEDEIVERLNMLAEEVDRLRNQVESKNAALASYHALVTELKANQRTGRIVHGDA